MRNAFQPILTAGRFAACVVAALLFTVCAAANQSTDETVPKHHTSTAAPHKASSDSQHKTSSAVHKPAASTAHKRSTKATGARSAKSGKARSRTAARRHRRPSAKARRIKLAFVASAELRPMAQQLATMRTPAAYAGVTAYAHRNTGEAAATAYLALGHAYMLDRRWADAVTSLRDAKKNGDVLADYADFLEAKANHEAGNEAAAETLLHGFVERHPDSIFDAQAPELEASVLLALHDAAGAQRALSAAADGPAADRTGYQLARAQVSVALGKPDEADSIFKQILLDHPLSPEAEIARTRLMAEGAETSLATTELRTLADAYYKAHRYAEASEQYHALARRAGLDAQSRAGFSVAAADCDLRLKVLTPAQVQGLPDTDDDNGARRLYLLMELARDRNDTVDQQRIVALMETRFPQSEWLAEALYSSGNMYLLSRDYPKAVEYYGYLATHFPQDKQAPAAHWRAGWLSYREGLYADAARLFDEQIHLYPDATETAAALYWRARLYEQQDNKPGLAAANYRTIVRAYQHYFYGQMARERLAALGTTLPVEGDPDLDRFKAPVVPVLDDSFPDDSEHLAKAKLLANAGLSDYIPQEIAADPDSGSWSALAEAQIYASDGDTFRAMRSLKKALPYAATVSVDAIPLIYWRILFPEPYWETIKVESAKNNLDPYLVASLIRQESEFNPSVISYANAYGLMQLLPAVGKAMAREEGISHFETFQLLNPEINIRLGTRYLRQMLERFNGVPEYALAAYNAGDSRVTDWEGAGPYHGMDEFVESIPFTQTREYVQAILRNVETYKAIDAAAASRGGETAAR